MAWNEFLEHLEQSQFCCPKSEIQTTDVCFVLAHICSIGTTQQAPLCDFYQYIPSPQPPISRESKGLTTTTNQRQQVTDFKKLIIMKQTVNISNELLIKQCSHSCEGPYLKC